MATILTKASVCVLTTGFIEPVDWSKVKELEFQERLSEMQRHSERLRSGYQCLLCPELNEHVLIVNLMVVCDSAPREGTGC